MRSPRPTGATAKHGTPSTQLWLNCFLLLVSMHVTFTTCDLGIEINKDYYQQQQENTDADEINPCDLSNMANSSGYCFCTPEEPSSVDTVKCAYHRNPNDRDWNVVSMLQSATVVEIANRPASVVTELPPAYVFTALKNLHYFSIKMTALDNIPSYAFGNSSSIGEIDMQNNNIHSLSSYAFTNLQNVTVIKLNDNNLTEINRDVFVSLPKLRELLLMTNRIQVIHDNALKDLGTLKDLSLRDNRVSVITREVFSGLRRLENLDLHGNALEYIGDHVFAEMPRLQDLDLSENMIKSLSATALKGPYKLQRLNLRNNKIVTFKPTTFAYLDKIYFLDLRNNALESLHEELMKPIYQNLRDNNMQLHVEGNRFMCDCHILWMQKLYNETESAYIQRKIPSVSCNMFENTGKQDGGVAYPSETILHTELEDTTRYAFESEKYILNLTAKELNCDERGAEMDSGRDKTPRKKHDDADGHSRTSHGSSFSTYHHLQQQSNPKLTADQQAHEQSHKNKLISATEWETNGESHQRDHHSGGGISSEENPDGNSGVHRQLTSLHEPQATAALADVGGNAPKRTSTGDQKVDTSRISSKYPDSSSAGVKCPNCDSRLLLSIVASFCIILKL